MDARNLIKQRSGLSDAMLDLSDRIDAIAADMVSCLRGGGTVYACGNGGSASQATHFVGELVGRFKMERSALPAFSLADNVATLTAVANDYSFDEVFARQLDGLAKPGDCLLALSTSGNSPNVVSACRTARELGARVFLLTGKNPGRCGSHADVVVDVPSDDTPLIQEMHIMVIHVVCHLVEAAMFGKGDG